MKKLKIDPNEGRRSGDVWSVLALENISFSKGDIVFLDANSNALGFDDIEKSKNKKAIKFLGIADESKQRGLKKHIIVLSKGVYPFNKTNKKVKIGEQLTCSCNNELIYFDGISKHNIFNKSIAIAYKDASESDKILFAKIKTQY